MRSPYEGVICVIDGVISHEVRHCRAEYDAVRVRDIGNVPNDIPLRGGHFSVRPFDVCRFGCAVHILSQTNAIAKSGAIDLVKSSTRTLIFPTTTKFPFPNNTLYHKVNETIPSGGAIDHLGKMEPDKPKPKTKNKPRTESQKQNRNPKKPETSLAKLATERKNARSEAWEHSHQSGKDAKPQVRGCGPEYDWI